MNDSFRTHSANPVKAQQRLLRRLSTRVDHLIHATDSVTLNVDGDAGSTPEYGQLEHTTPHPCRQPRQLLQESLWPLSHESESCLYDLQPHAAPKAKELYNVLVQGLPIPPWYMLNPDGTTRMLWDFMLAVFTMALVVYLPVYIAFYNSTAECTFFSEKEPEGAAEAHAPLQPHSGVRFILLTNVAFLADIVLNFLTGIRQINQDTGMIEYCYNLKAVAANYARTWLLLDVLCLLPVECMIAAAGIEHSYNLGYLVRLLRVFGLKRRAHGDPFRLIDQLPWVRHNFNYSLRLVVVSVTVLLLGLHYFACTLWLVLRVQGFPANTWPVQLGLVDDINVYEAWTWSVFAVTSAMIGLGYGSYPPMTLAEAILWIVEMMFMAGGFAVVNGFILSAILEALAGRARYKAKLLQVQRGLQRFNLPDVIANRVIAFFELKHGDTVTQDSSAVMAELAPGLRLQVALSCVGHLLAKLPVLRSTPQLLHRTALLMQAEVAPEGQLITIPGTPQKHLYFLTKGYADLYMGNILVDTLVAGDSFGETALLPVPAVDDMPSRLAELWTDSKTFSRHWWPTLFSVRALSNCSLAVLDGVAFAELLQEYGWVQQHLQDLGRHHALVLAALPMLEQVWKTAAAFEPVESQLPSASNGAGRHQVIAGAVSRRKKAGLSRPAWWPGKRSHTPAGLSTQEVAHVQSDSGSFNIRDQEQGSATRNAM